MVKLFLEINKGGNMVLDEIMVIYSYAKDALTADWSEDKNGDFKNAFIGAVKLGYEWEDKAKFINFVRTNSCDVDGYYPFKSNKYALKSEQIIDMMTIVCPRIDEAMLSLNMDFKDCIKYEKLLLLAERQRLAGLQVNSNYSENGITVNCNAFEGFYKNKFQNEYKTYSDREKSEFEQYVGNAITMFMKGHNVHEFSDALPGETYVVGNPVGAWEVAVQNMPENMANFEC